MDKIENWSADNTNGPYRYDTVKGGPPLKPTDPSTKPPDLLLKDNILGDSSCESNQPVFGSSTQTVSNQDRVVAVYPPPPAIAKVTILQMDLDTLDDGNELNDSIVDFFMLHTAHKYSMDQDGNEMLKKSHIFSSVFYSNLTTKVKQGKSYVLPSANARYQRVSSFVRNVTIF